MPTGIHDKSSAEPRPSGGLGKRERNSPVSLQMLGFSSRRLQIYQRWEEPNLPGWSRHPPLSSSARGV